MIQFKKDATNYLRALVKDSNGAIVNDATVTGEFRVTYGEVLFPDSPMAPVAGHDTDPTPYNYEVEIPADVFTDLRTGVLYEAKVTARKNGKVTPEVITAEVVD